MISLQNERDAIVWGMTTKLGAGAGGKRALGSLGFPQAIRIIVLRSK
jgi:hypothetical protein